MYNINPNNINLDDLNRCFEPFLTQEREVFRDSLKMEPEVVLVLIKMEEEFYQLWKDVIAGKFGKNHQQCLCRLRGIMQSLYSSSLFLMRGNIRAGYSEMRFLIEEVCMFVYLLDNNNCDLLFSKTDDFNEPTREVLFGHLEGVSPHMNKSLKQLKTTISEHLMHSKAIGVHDAKSINFSDGKLIVDAFDSKELRNGHLGRSLEYLISIMFASHEMICAGLERRSNVPVREYRERVDSIGKLSREIVDPVKGRMGDELIKMILRGITNPPGGENA